MKLTTRTHETVDGKDKILVHEIAMQKLGSTYPMYRIEEVTPRIGDKYCRIRHLGTSIPERDFERYAALHAEATVIVNEIISR